MKEAAVALAAILLLIPVTPAGGQKVVTLEEALSRGLISQARIARGNGEFFGRSICFEFESRVGEDLVIVVERGTFFTPEEGVVAEDPLFGFRYFDDKVVARDLRVEVPAGGVGEACAYAFSLSRYDAVAGEDVHYTLMDVDPWLSDLMDGLLEVLEEEGEYDTLAGQLAVWAATGNVDLDLILEQEDVDPADVERARELLREAGIGEVELSITQLLLQVIDADVVYGREPDEDPARALAMTFGFTLTDRDRGRDVVVVGGPVANPLAAQLNEEAGVSFTVRPGEVVLEYDGRTWRVTGADYGVRDYAIVASATIGGRRVLLVEGCTRYGTEAAALALTADPFIPSWSPGMVLYWEDLNGNGQVEMEEISTDYSRWPRISPP